MWLMTVDGFFSVVAFLEPNGRIDPARLLVRSRDRQHLVRVQTRYQLPGKITHLSDADYPYRMVVWKTDWLRVTRDMMQRIDYPNFKSAVAARRRSWAAYLEALHDVWLVLRDRFEGVGV